MFFAYIEPSEYVPPVSSAIVCKAEITTSIIEPEAIEVRNYGPDHWVGIIIEAQSQRMDAQLIANRCDEPSEPLEKVLTDLGLS